MLCCLPFLCPGKFCRRIRILCFSIMAFGMLYIATWVLVAKSLKFSSSGNVIDNNLSLVISVTNNSIVAVEFIDFVMHNEDGDKVVASMSNLPKIIDKYCTDNLNLVFPLMEYKSTGVTLKILGWKETFTSQLKSTNEVEPLKQMDQPEE